MMLIVRHGRTESNRSGLLLGRADPHLDGVGVAQAAACAEWLGTVDRVVTSPLRRAVATAHAIAAVGDVSIEIDERLIELDYGDWDGRPVADVTADEWADWRADPSFAPPGGESLSALDVRVRDALSELGADDRARGARRTVVVSHVSPIKSAVAWALGVGPETTWRMFVAPASISTIEVRDAGVVLAGFNERGHLRALTGE